MSCHTAPAGRPLVTRPGHPTRDGASESRPLRVALLGNPNVGKSTVFNWLTGMHQHVGNWPGKTVDHRVGRLDVAGRCVELVDLPGIYELSPYTLEECVAREYLLDERPGLLICVVDAARLERNLYLVIDALDLGIPTVVALTMLNEPRDDGRSVDAAGLAACLGVPVVPMDGRTGSGLEALLERIAAAARGELAPPPGTVRLGTEMEAAIRSVEEVLAPGLGLPARWAAIKALEGDPRILALLGGGSQAARAALAAFREGAMRVADERYRWIQSHAPRCLTAARAASPRRWAAEQVDVILTHRYAGPMVTLLLLAGAIWGAFRMAAPPRDALAWAFGALAGLAGAVIRPPWPEWVRSLVVDGVIGGVATVAEFVPIIGAFFVLLGVLEDSGYFARAAFVLDRLVGRFGIQGRCGIGLLVGLGCNVPAVMAARTAHDARSRLFAMLLVPPVICSARLVVVGYVTSVFFGPSGAWVVAGLYLTSAGLVVGMAALLNRTAFRQEPEPMLIELPPFRWPRPKDVLTYAWHESALFLRRALVIIAPMTVAVWAASYFPGGSIDTSLLGRVGQFLAPLGAPLGLDWRMIVALLSGFLAKEGTLSAIAVLYGTTGAGGLAGALQAAVEVPQALAFVTFFAFYTPCLATVVTIYQESRSARSTAFAVANSLAVAALLAFVVFHGARWLGPWARTAVAAAAGGAGG